jgi:hypothetical protein
MIVVTIKIPEPIMEPATRLVASVNPKVLLNSISERIQVKMFGNKKSNKFLTTCWIEKYKN